MSTQGDSQQDEPNVDWRRLGAVAILAVALSLIGFSVASRYQPADDAGSVAPAAGGTTTSTTTSTTVAVITTPPVETTTGAADDGPVALALSEALLDFGEGGETLELLVVNESETAAAWALEPGHPALSVDPSEGELAAGASVSVTIVLDRSQLDEGVLDTTLTLSWGSGEADATVVAVEADNPIIHNPQASPGTVQVDTGGGCSPTRTTISARIRDTSEIDRVIARWSHDGAATRETAMSPVGNDVYEGVIGPYETVGSDSVKVVAFDIYGNAGGASITVSVTDCS